MTPSGQRFLLALPRTEVQIDDDGQPSIAGLTIGDLTDLVGDRLELSPDYANLLSYYANWMKLTDVQHMELVHTADGLFLFVNGTALPYLAWDGESLANTGAVASMLNVPYGQLITLLSPILERTGLNMVLRFPTAESAEEIPLRDPSALPEPAVAEVTDPSTILKMDVDYDANGIPSFAGINSNELFSAAGLTMNMLALSPQTVQLMQQNGVEDLRIMSRGDGVFLTVNDMPLPHLAWSDGQLQAGANVYAQMNPTSDFIELANFLVPQLDNLDIDLRLRFPTE
jgi:hypothetical protein